MQNQEAVLATYQIHDRGKDLSARARFMADSLTVGDWRDLSPQRALALAPHRGQVIQVQERDGVGLITIAYPLANLLPSPAALLTTVFGKLSLDGAIRLVDLRLPNSFAQALGGPKHGAEGLRKLLGVPSRPLLLGIFKGTWGLSLEELAEQFRQLALGGCDLVKDDEIFYAPETLTQRTAAMAQVAREVEAKIGQRTLYVPNLTGPLAQLLPLAQLAKEAGAGALLLPPWTMGLESLAFLAKVGPDLPILAHPALAGAMGSAPTHGIAPAVLAALQRWAGADAVMFAAPSGSLALADGGAPGEIAERLREGNCLLPSLPAPAAGVKPEKVAELVAELGADILLAAGGAIHNHPGGSRAGAEAFRQAIGAS